MVLPDPWIAPTLTAVDEFNMDTVTLTSTQALLNFDSSFDQVLFSDSRFDDYLNQMSYSQYGKSLLYHFDGYAFYQKIKWLRTDQTTFTPLTRGIFTEIPYRGYAGWVCSLYNCEDCSEIVTSTTADDGTVTETTTYESYYAYNCLSRFISLEDFNFVLTDTLPDLTTSQSDDGSKYQYQGLNGVWQCNVTSEVVAATVSTPEQTWDTATCTTELPRENGADYLPLFRFVPGDSYPQLGYIINDSDINFTEFGENQLDLSVQIQFQVLAGLGIAIMSVLM